MGKRVLIVDTSNEIAGDGDVPHDCIGRARRMQVSSRAQQEQVMIEAVQNHTPHVIIIDEIGTAKEVRAARTISQRGVSLVATAHGIDLGSLLKNPALCSLVGGVHPVILGDKQAKRNKQGRIVKTVLERAGAPTFDCLVELVGRNNWRVYHNVAQTVDAMLAQEKRIVESRWLAADSGKMMARFSKISDSSEDIQELQNQFELNSNNSTTSSTTTTTTTTGSY